MLKTLQKIFCGENLIFTNKRALFWEKYKILLISDLHIGKTAHFRKNGIAIPAEVLEKDLRRLGRLIHHFSAEKVIIVGDLFHASYNSDLEIFRNWRERFPQDFLLVKGNHDRGLDDIYKNLKIEISKDFMDFAPFRFIHEPQNFGENIFTISGHIHPGIFLETKTERLRLPSFAFSQNQIILPAFSNFTGLDTKSVAKFSHIAFTKDFIFEM